MSQIEKDPKKLSPDDDREAGCSFDSFVKI